MELEQACKREHSPNHVTEDSLKRLVDAYGISWYTGSHYRVSDEGSRLDSYPFAAVTWEGSVDSGLRRNVCASLSTRLRVRQNLLHPAHP